MSNRPYPPETSALVLIDVLNDFLSPEGKMAGMIGPMLEKLDLVPQLTRLLQAVRQAGVPVFYAPHGLNEHSFNDVKHLHPRMQMALDNQVFWEGSSGADFFSPLRPQPGDVVVGRHRMFDSFIGTDLDEQLRRRGIEKVILAGLTSHTCIEGTGRHALEAGYHVTFLTDAVADFTEADHCAAVEVAYPKFGHAALTVDAFLARLTEAAAVQAG